jgi:hypothetical protein
MAVSLPKNNDVYMGLTILAIEKTLLDIGKPIYDKVISMLNKNYHCYLTDCYEHPEYLSETLKKLYGNSHNEIIESINKKLEEFSNKEPIERFLQVIHR